MSASPSYGFDDILKRDLTAFTELAFRELNPQTAFSRSQHIKVMASKLEACRLEKIRRLIINLPPRSLKSHTASIAFPAWMLGHNPGVKIICASYGQDLSENLARESRRLMMTSFYRRLFPQTRLSPEKQSVSEFITTAQGFRMSTSVGGVLTGRGADILIIDDPQKPQDALSETRRASVNEWFDNTATSRLNNKNTGAIIIVTQRLHQDDLVGHIREHDDWEVVTFPAIAEEDEEYFVQGPLGPWRFRRKAGDVLDPSRESGATLQRIRETSGEYNFQSQDQQQPMPLGGAIIKTGWIQYCDPAQIPNSFIAKIQSWDTASKSGDLNDYSVCTTWGIAPGKRLHLLEVFRKRLNYPELKKAVHEQARKHRPNTILVEDKSSGISLIQDLKFEGLFGVKPYLPPPGSDKLMRLIAQSGEFEGGFVFLPSSAPWLQDYVKELTGFPGTKYDDQVDSTTQALDHMRKYRVSEMWAKLGR